jgi:hypothetical protein
MEFVGRFVTKDKRVVSVTNETAKNLVLRLHEKADKFLSIADSIVIGEFFDERFFGKSLSELSSIKRTSFLYRVSSDRLNNRDDIEKLQRDAIEFSKYLEYSGDSFSNKFNFPSTEELERFYSGFSGKKFDGRQVSFMSRLLAFLSKIPQENVTFSQINSLAFALVYCFLSEDNYDAEVVSELEKCGIFGFSKVKSEMLLNMVMSTSFVSEGRARFALPSSDPSQSSWSDETYAQVLSVIKKVTENYLTPVGQMKDEVI